MCPTLVPAGAMVCLRLLAPLGHIPAFRVYQPTELDLIRTTQQLLIHRPRRALSPEAIAPKLPLEPGHRVCGLETRWYPQNPHHEAGTNKAPCQTTQDRLLCTQNTLGPDQQKLGNGHFGVTHQGNRGISQSHRKSDPPRQGLQLDKLLALRPQPLRYVRGHPRGPLPPALGYLGP